MSELILNRYKPIDEAGSGGFATVIAAWDTRVNRKVAIKCIKLDTNTFGNIVDAAGEHWEENVPGLAEARTAAMIQDSNIVTVYDFEIEGDMAYIIMEYVEGMTLTQFLFSYGDEMTLDMATSLITEISHAVVAGHDENVLHLDIKPDNILIDTKGKVKVTDFGLATLADEFGYGTAEAGTLGYMPPEQMRRQGLDARSDEWALACLIYEMLVGKNPFEAKDIPSALEKIHDANLELPTNSWEDLDDDVNDIIFSALQPDPEKRYSTVAEFVDDLLPHLGSAKAGKRQLSALLRKKDNEEIEVEEKKQKRDMSWVSKVLPRAYSVLVSTFLAIIGCVNINNPFIYLSLIPIVVMSAAFPVIGFGLSVCLLCISLFIHGNYIIAIIFVLVTIPWCVYSWKAQARDANIVGSFPLFGAFGFTQFAPFVSGTFSCPLHSVINTLYGGLLCCLLASFGTNTLVGWDVISNWKMFSGISDDVFKLMAQPQTYVWLICWILCSLIVSLSFKTRSRGAKILGITGGFVIMIVCICLSNYFISGFVEWQPQGWELLPTILAYALSLIIAVFLPSRGSKLTPREE
ncbi:MAG: serine/threonine-protein kinase [Coriobacteriia bacterium]|nr:serine/threonine-protein kinase [Coriobacteriia bacterium]